MKTVVVGTAGHIDHGKSTLVRALTGTDPDRLKEEKARGITIDLGFAHVDVDGVNLSFVDVPGHERFVKNMLAGVGGVDMVLLVVAADESVMPQTREHFEICRLLRVPAGLVALTKADMVDAESLQLATLEVRELVAGSFLEGSPIVPVSGRTGAGLDALRQALVTVASKVTARSAEGVTRLPIDRVFTMKGFGTVVTGTLLSGRIRVGDALVVAPDREAHSVTVRGLQVHGTPRDEAVAGERTAVNVTGVDVQDVARGQVLTVAQALSASRVIDAALELLPNTKPLRHGTRVRFHHGTAEVIGRVAIVGSGVALEGSGYVRLRLERPVVLTRGDRFILRTYSPLTTIAGGVVLDPQPPRMSIRRETTLSRCRRLDGLAEDLGAGASAAALMIDEAGRVGLPARALVSRVGLSPRAASMVEARLVDARHAQRIEDVLVAPGVLAALKHTIVERLEAHHRADPLSEGLFREQARQQLFGRGHPAVFERAVAELVTDGQIVARDRLTLTTHRVALSAEEERVAAVIEATIRRGGLTPPDATSVVAAAGASKELVERVVQYLQRRKRLVKIDTLLFHEDTLAELKAQVRALKKEGSAIRLDVATFKDRFGVTRKFAIPLLEYLDRERITRRIGDARALL